MQRKLKSNSNQWTMQWRKKPGNMETCYDNQSIYISVTLPSEPVDNDGRFQLLHVGYENHPALWTWCISLSSVPTYQYLLNKHIIQARSMMLCILSKQQLYWVSQGHDTDIKEQTGLQFVRIISHRCIMRYIYIYIYMCVCSCIMHYSNASPV